ncbi:MAG: hypothetical protein AB7U35_14090 [Sphingobium sp.]
MSARIRPNRRTDDAAAAAPAEASSAATWGDLSEDERTALKRMNRGPYPALTQAMGQRLIELGLAVPRADGVGISRAGRELVIGRLLDPQRRD